ncbi:MAG: CDP-alcohol phosphatidyltransferase family protein [Actinobacteria bacterium]|jgi:cardiolipin synthase|nr:CDP-alcohol phosphatidyltransferase family protein [Actinomycetota bacterium]MBU1493906.1 CDP-alcohol phosphatidyltransferase family protein [Actinomycetota bacterium]
MIFTIPNLISAARIAAVPFFLWLLLGADDPAAAGWTLVAIGATDWIDGFLARALHQVSELGKMLDPIADRLAIVAALVGGWIAGVVPWWVALLLLVREALLGAMTLYLARRTKTRIEVRYMGKMATWAVYGGVASFYIYAGTGWAFFHWWSWLYIVPGLIFYYVVAFQYVGDARRLLAEPQAPVISD